MLSKLFSIFSMQLKLIQLTNYMDSLIQQKNNFSSELSNVLFFRNDVVHFLKRITS